MGFYRQFIKGLWEEIPVFRVVLGMCPAIAVSTSVENGLGMGLASTFVLVCSNVAISSLRKIIPKKVRIPCYIVVIATFVTVVDLMMNGFAHELHKNLGIFIPLIVVNCLILGRTETFASKNRVWISFADGIGMGLGFTFALVVVSGFREVLGNGTFTIWGNLGWTVYNFPPALLMILAPGGFLALGCLLAAMNQIQARIAKRRGKTYTAPDNLDCRHCVICKWGETEPQAKTQ